MHFLRMDANVLKDKTDREMENRQTSQYIPNLLVNHSFSCFVSLNNVCNVCYSFILWSLFGTK